MIYSFIPFHFLINYCSECELDQFPLFTLFLENLCCGKVVSCWLSVKEKTVINIANDDCDIAKVLFFLLPENNFCWLEDLFGEVIHFLIKISVSADVDKITLWIANRAHLLNIGWLKTLPELLWLFQHLAHFTSFF